MKRNTIATVICTAVIAAAIVVPFGINHAPEIEAALQAEPESQAETPEGAQTDLTEAENPQKGDRASNNLRYEEGVILVGLQDTATVANLNARIADLDYIATKQVAEDDVVLGYAELALADGADVKTVETRIAQENPDVIASAQPNYLYHAIGDATEQTASSPLIASIVTQAATINDAYAGRQWALEAVNAYDAWDTVKTGDAGSSRISVAVIDNGFLVNHEDLASNIVATYDAVDGGTDVSPEFGSHGTHVAGIVSAITNNDKGVAGVSYNAGLLPIQAFTEDGASSISLRNAYNYILQHADDYNIKVVNMSLGATCTWKLDQMADYPDDDDDALIDAIESAYQKGILTVCAAGNDVGETVEDERGRLRPITGAYLNFPGDWVDDALQVIALDSNNERASYSNYNMTGQKTKDIAAPGGDGNDSAGQILSTYATSANTYGYMAGTSMASPYVAGIAALVYSVNPGLSAAEVAEILCTTTTDLGTTEWDNDFGSGAVNAQAAVESAAEAGYLEGDAELPIGGSTTLAPSKGGTWEWSSSDESVATVSDAGKVEGVGRGRALITATQEEVSLSKIITVQKSLSGAEVNITSASYTYTGAAIKPAVTVTLDGNKLTQDIDYKVGYSNNVNAGSATVIVTGAGSCTGTITKSFSIAKAPLSSVSFAKTSYVYTGATITPNVTVTGPKNGKTGQALMQNSDYTLVAPYGRINVGTFTYAAIGKGNYTGTASASFTIIPKGTKVAKVTAAKKGFTVKWKKQAAQTSGYQVQYSLKSNFSAKNKTVTIGKNTTVSKKIKKLKAKKKYYVRVRTYKTVSGVKYYSAWSAKKTVKTKA